MASDLQISKAAKPSSKDPLPAAAPSSPASPPRPRPWLQRPFLAPLTPGRPGSRHPRSRALSAPAAPWVPSGRRAPGCAAAASGSASAGRAGAGGWGMGIPGRRHRPAEVGRAPMTSPRRARPARSRLGVRFSGLGCPHPACCPELRNSCPRSCERPPRGGRPVESWRPGRALGGPWASEPQGRWRGRDVFGAHAAAEAPWYGAALTVGAAGNVGAPGGPKGGSRRCHNPAAGGYTAGVGSCGPRA